MDKMMWYSTATFILGLVLLFMGGRLWYIALSNRNSIDGNVGELQIIKGVVYLSSSILALFASWMTWGAT